MKLNDKNLYQRIASSTENKIRLETFETIEAHFNSAAKDELHIIVERIACMLSSPLPVISN
jgi:hypothetical protein